MKTTFIQQIVAAAIFSVAMTRTFATPMPTAIRTSPDVTSYIYPRNNDGSVSSPGRSLVPLPNHGHDHHRNLVPAPIIFVQTSINDLLAPIDEIADRFEELVNTHPQHHADIETTSELLQSALVAHDIWNKLSPLYDTFWRIMSIGLQFSMTRSVSLLKSHHELGMTEATGTPVIKDLIGLLRGTLVKQLEDKEPPSDVKSYSRIVLGLVKEILDLQLKWKVIDELERVQSEMDKRLIELHA